MKEKTIEELREIISNIASLCFKINVLTPHAAFLNYSGHVNMIDVHITKSKEDFEERIYGKMITMNSKFTNDSCFEKVQSDLFDILASKSPIVYIVKVVLAESSFKKEFALKKEAQEFYKEMKDKYKYDGDTVTLYPEKVGI